MREELCGRRHRARLVRRVRAAMAASSAMSTPEARAAGSMAAMPSAVLRRLAAARAPRGAAAARSSARPPAAESMRFAACARGAAGAMQWAGECGGALANARAGGRGRLAADGMWGGAAGALGRGGNLEMGGLETRALGLGKG